MNNYHGKSSLGGQHPYSLNEICTGHDFLGVPSEYEYVTTALISSVSNSTFAITELETQDLSLSDQRTFAANQLSVLIYPRQVNLVFALGAPSRRNRILGTLTGSPVVVVPVSFSPATATATERVLIGMKILGEEWAEERLLRIAWHIERLGTVRQIPSWAKQVVEVMEYENVPEVMPKRNKIPAAYPVGVL